MDRRDRTYVSSEADRWWVHEIGGGGGTEPKRDLGCDLALSHGSTLILWSHSVFDIIVPGLLYTELFS